MLRRLEHEKHYQKNCEVVGDRRHYEFCTYVETEDTLRGRLTMTFIAAVTLKMMSDKLSNISPTTETMIMNLHEQHTIVYDKEFITTEPVKNERGV